MTTEKRLIEINKFRDELSLTRWEKLWSREDQKDWAGLITDELTKEKQELMMERRALSLVPEFQESIEVKQWSNNAWSPMPRRKHSADAGLDLFSTEDVYVPPSGLPVQAHTGYAIKIPAGTVGLIMPRSGLALKHGIIVLGGVLDEGFQGEVVVMLRSAGDKSYMIPKGQAVAQLVVMPRVLHEPKLVEPHGCLHDQRNQGFRK